MHYQWDESLETGYEGVDMQHKQLMTYLGNLTKAYMQDKSKEELQTALDFLTAYTVKHFNDEEALQIEHNYPDYLRHKNYHNSFKKTISDFAFRLKETGYSSSLVQEAIITMGRWLTNHIKGDDFTMATYIKYNKKNN